MVSDSGPRQGGGPSRLPSRSSRHVVTRCPRRRDKARRLRMVYVLIIRAGMNHRPEPWLRPRRNPVPCPSGSARSRSARGSPTLPRSGHRGAESGLHACKACSPHHHDRGAGNACLPAGPASTSRTIDGLAWCGQGRQPRNAVEARGIDAPHIVAIHLGPVPAKGRRPWRSRGCRCVAPLRVALPSSAENPRRLRMVYVLNDRGGMNHRPDPLLRPRRNPVDFPRTRLAPKPRDRQGRLPFARTGPKWKSSRCWISFPCDSTTRRGRRP